MCAGFFILSFVSLNKSGVQSWALTPGGLLQKAIFFVGKRGVVATQRREDGSGRRSPGGLSPLSLPGSAVQEERRLKWRRCF